jgi:hypothetical protein
VRPRPDLLGAHHRDLHGHQKAEIHRATVLRSTVSKLRRPHGAGKRYQGDRSPLAGLDRSTPVWF